MFALQPVLGGGESPQNGSIVTLDALRLQMGLPPFQDASFEVDHGTDDIKG
jgi:hypothetical protein